MTEEKEKKTIDISYVPDEEDVEDTEQKGEDKTPKKTTVKKRPSPKELQKKLEEQEELLHKVIKERDEYKDNYLRTLAEMDNFRKRVQKDKEEYQKYALSEFFLDLLQIFDNLERALKAISSSADMEPAAGQEAAENEKSIISGIEMIYKQFSDLLKKYNVLEIDALNKVFDPNLHQALTKEEREGITEPIVVEIYQKGFLYNGKLLKPTLAKVAIPIETEETEEIEEEE